MSVSTITVSQYARPLKVAFLVNRNTYREAMEVNATLWGGRANPLVPVKVSASRIEKDASLGILSDFDPDIIVNMTPYKYSYINTVYKNGVLRKVMYTKAEMFGTSHRSGRTILNIGTSIAPILREIWDEGKIIGETSNFSFVQNDNYIDWDDMLLAVLGRYPSEDPLAFTDDYKTVIKPKEITFEQDCFDIEKLYEHGSPLSLTLYGLENLGDGFSSMSSHVLYLGKLSSWQDMVEFWNIRATGSQVVFVPYEHYVSFKNSADTIVKEADYPINPHVQNSATLMSSGSISKDELDEYADWLRDELGHNLARRYFGVVWNRRHTLIAPDIGVARYVTAEKEEVTAFTDDRSTQFYLSTPTFLSSNKGFREKGWANVVSFSGYYGDDYCYGFPIDPNVEELVQRSMMELENSRLSKQGVVVFSRYPKSRVFYTPIETYKVVEALFKTAGYTINLSQPGRIAQNLINFLGGIERARFLKIDGIRRALRELNRKSIDASNITNTIRQYWHGVDDDDMILIGGQGTPLTPSKAFEALLNSKLIRPGIDFRCKQCGQSAWCSIKDFGEQFECVYCFLKQDVPRLDKTDWKYTTNGLARIKDEGYGSIPVLLSLWRYSHFSSHNSAQGMTSIELHSNSFDCEIDYLYIATSSNGEYELVIGEAKGYEEITPKVVKKMRRIADVMKTSPYISFSTLKDELNSTEKRRLLALISKGYKVIILTRKELEPYDLFDRFDGLKDKYAHSLSQLADNTQQLNL